jgi:hypothetical protein
MRRLALNLTATAAGLLAATYLSSASASADTDEWNIEPIQKLSMANNLADWSGDDIPRVQALTVDPQVSSLPGVPPRLTSFQRPFGPSRPSLLSSPRIGG